MIVVVYVYGYLGIVKIQCEVIPFFGFFFFPFLYKLPMIAKGIGKNQFKRYLELFIDTIFFSLVSQINLFLFPIYNTIHYFLLTTPPQGVFQ